MPCLLILFAGYAAGTVVALNPGFGLPWCIAFVVMCIGGWMAGKYDRILRSAVN